MMSRRHDAGGRVPTLSARLRREARAMQPGFSKEFHDRLMVGIASRADARSEARDVSLRRPIGGRRLIALLGVGALAGAVALLVTGGVPVGAHRGGKLAESLVASDAVASATGSIEAIPLYDDIDASMRNGVWMLASTLVDVPDWVRLADFDAPGSLSDTAGP